MIFTGLIVFSGQQTAREALKTEKVLAAAKEIAADSEISSDAVKEVEVPARMVRDEWITAEESDQVEGRITRVPILKEQFIDRRFLHPKGEEMTPGHVGIVIFVDIANSAAAEPGDLVDIHYIPRDREADVAPVLVREARVLRAITEDGGDKPLVADEGGMAGMGARDRVVALKLCVPKEYAEKVVFYAAEESLYLVRSAIPAE
ncbi:hypothetical protein M1N04_00945 [Peptococcaceae bacterium]|nr:hypothetical protein [Peptococcaceae bacterium]